MYSINKLKIVIQKVKIKFFKINLSVKTSNLTLLIFLDSLIGENFFI